MTEALRQIETQIMWNRLISVVEEQAQTLIRTAFSTTVREAGDLSAGVFDLDGRMLAQAVTGTPGHVNAMAASVGFFLEVFPVAAMQEGDVYITNDPWKGTGHLLDFTVVTPTFRNGEVVALFACTSHVVDVGGLGFGPDGRQVYEEGLYVPIMKLADRDGMNDSLLQLVRANVREPVQVEGDLYSLAACNETGCKRLLDMMDEYGLDSIAPLAEHIIETSHAGMLEKIRALPRGTYRNAMRIDGLESPVDLVCALTVADDGIDIDFAGTSGLSSYGINVPLTYTQAYASFGVRCVVGSDVPNNAGSLGAIRVTAPEGSILNAPHPCAVTARHVTGQMLPDVVLGCLGQVLGGSVPAEGTSCLYNPVLMGGHGLGGGGEAFAVSIFHAGGTGARPAKDGLSATAFPSGVRNTPSEITEAVSPMLILKKEYRTDSGGPGRWRGGLGQVMEVSRRDGEAWSISPMFDRFDHPPRGRAQGQDGQTGRMYLTSGGALRAKGRQLVPAGETLVIEMPGGGGIGAAIERAPQSVVDDVRLGLVTPGAAEAAYKVVLAGDGTLDADATAALRGGKAAAE